MEVDNNFVLDHTTLTLISLYIVLIACSIALEQCKVRKQVDANAEIFVQVVHYSLQVTTGLVAGVLHLLCRIITS